MNFRLHPIMQPSTAVLQIGPCISLSPMTTPKNRGWHQPMRCGIRSIDLGPMLWLKGDSMQEGRHSLVRNSGGIQDAACAPGCVE